MVKITPAMPGNAYLFDLSNNPTVDLNAPFSTVRMNISQSALDALADAQVPAPVQIPAPMDYLRLAEPWALDVRLELAVNEAQ